MEEASLARRRRGHRSERRKEMRRESSAGVQMRETEGRHSEADARDDSGERGGRGGEKRKEKEKKRSVTSWKQLGEFVIVMRANASSRQLLQKDPDGKQKAEASTSEQR